MLQNNYVYFQWVPIAPGDSMQHNCNMERQIDEVAARVEHQASMLARIQDVLRKSGLNLSMKAADWAAMRLVWLWSELPSVMAHSKTQLRGRRRPPKDFSTWAALIIIEAVQESTKTNATLPTSKRNKKPRGLQPLVREIFQVCGFDAKAKAGIAAAELAVKTTEPEHLMRPLLGRWTNARDFLERVLRQND
jgi:hypothetical protein